MATAATPQSPVHVEAPDNGVDDAEVPVPVFRAILYSCDEPARILDIDELAGTTVHDDQLLWVALCAPDAELVAKVAQALALPEPVPHSMSRLDSAPTLQDAGTWFVVQVIAARLRKDMRFDGQVISVACGVNVIVTVTDMACAFIDDLYQRQHRNTMLGALNAESFVVSLIDGQLASYFDAMSRLEAEVDRVEVRLLADHEGDYIQLLRVLRTASSRLRRTLAGHRFVFGYMVRPDFRPKQSRQLNEHFAALQARYERCMDLVEHGRDLVLGSFELFTTRAAMSTNETMRVLTFVTVLIGGLAVVVGVLGMNFAAPFFDTGARGFWTAVASMVLLAMLALGVGRYRRWL